MSKIKYNLKIAIKPRVDKLTGKCAPEDLPSLRRYQGVTGYMRKRGLTEEEAIALYDRPRGVCSCGAKVDGQGRRCHDCMLVSQREKQAKYRKDKRGWSTKTCKFEGCTAKFFGSRNKEYCAAHRKGTRAATYTPKAAKQVPRAAKQAAPARPVIPATWERPMPVKPKDVRPPVERIVNPGVEVTRYQPLPSRWESMAVELQDLDPARVRVVAKVMERRTQWNYWNER